MSEKELSFTIKIDGVSNEQSELAKLEIQLKNLKKERAELMKQATMPGHIGSTEERLKIAAYTREINAQETSLKTLKRVVDTASDSLDRKKASLIELTKKSNAATQAIRDQMAPGIKKLNDEISAGEQARGVFTRNVGNYPQLTKAAAEGLNLMGGAAGGVTGEITNVASSLLTAGGAVGIFTALIGALATAWKKTKENIELYLKSADKLVAGPAAFERDTEIAIKDARKRARGEEAEGLRVELLARRQLNLYAQDFTEEQKAALEAEITSGQKMQEHAKGLLKSLIAEKDRTEWKIKYNKLLTEEETLNDEKLANETKWEELEANLIKQRAIVSDQESTIVQKKQAANDADDIANQLIKEKTEFTDRQLTNVNAIADMTAKQEVYEDQINELERERNTIRKEYFSDQVKINRLARAAAGGKGAEDNTDEVMNRSEDYLKYIAPGAGDIPAEIQAEQFIQKEKDRLWAEGLQKARENYAENKQLAQEQGKELVAIDLEKLDQKREIAEMEMALGVSAIIGLSQIFKKSKALAIAAMLAEKAQAIPQIISNVAVANAKMIAISPATFGQPWVTINTGLGALAIAGLIAESARGVKEISKYKGGGRITGGMPINTGTIDDRLIAVNGTETILTARHVAMLGGSGAMRAIGLPGYSNGGYIGQQAPYISPSAAPVNMDQFNQILDAFNNRIDRLEVHNDIHKVRSSLHEIETIIETQRI